jgi:hypothetical protein
MRRRPESTKIIVIRWAHFYGVGYIPLRAFLDLTLPRINKRGKKNGGKGKGGAVGDNAFITGKLTKKFTAVSRQWPLVFLVEVG